MLSPVVSPSSKGSSAGKSKGFRFSPPVSEPETPVEPINPFKNIPLKKHNSILNILANTYDNNALHTNIYTGTKTFFRPYVKVDIDIIFHHKPKCLEVICYNCTTEMEAKPRLYLLYSEVLKRVIQTPEYQLKVKQLLVRSGKPAETASMDNKILSEAVQYVLISNFILNRLSIRKTSKVSKDIPSSTNSSSSHAQWNGNNKRVRNENDLSPGVNMVTDEEFVVDIVRLPIDKPSMAISVKNNVLTKNSDLKYTPSHHNDIEWCCQFIQENDTVDANKTKSVSKKNSGDTNGKVENDMKPEEHTRPLGIERVHIPRYQ